MYSSVTPGDSTTDSAYDLRVTGYTMQGFPNACGYTDWIALSYPLLEDIKVATSGDEFAWTCGYYVEYEWNGEGDVYFEVESNNAILKAISAFAFLAIGSLLL